MDTPSTVQSKAAGLFSDMVMEEAIRDKTIQVQKQIKDQEGQLHDVSQLGTLLKATRAPEEGDDEDFGQDAEEEKIMRSIREQRMVQMKGKYEEKQENLIKGHGQYTEIIEGEFLP